MTKKTDPQKPEPREQLVLQLPRSLKKALAATAKAKDTSMNQFVIDALKHLKKDAGYSLIEMVVAMALLLTLAAFTAPLFARPDQTLARVTAAEKTYAATACTFPAYSDSPAALGLPATPGLVIEGVGPVTCLRGTMRTKNDPVQLFLHYRATYHGETVGR